MIDKEIIKKKKIIDKIIVNQYKIRVKDDCYIISDNSLKVLNRINSSDIYVFDQIFIQEEYKPIVEFCFKKNIQIKTIIDCGANIGLSSIYFKNHFPNCKIYCIEPFIENVKIISLNFETNKLNAEILQGAVWNKNCLLSLNHSFRDGKEWSKNMIEDGINPDINAYTIKEIMNKANFDTIDLLKIDVEGAEKYIFDKNNSDISFLEKTKIIAIEIHDEFDCRLQITSILEEYCFELFTSGELSIGINKNLILC